MLSRPGPRFLMVLTLTVMLAFLFQLLEAQSRYKIHITYFKDSNYTVIVGGCVVNCEGVVESCWGESTSFKQERLGEPCPCVRCPSSFSWTPYLEGWGYTCDEARMNAISSARAYAEQSCILCEEGAMEISPCSYFGSERMVEARFQYKCEINICP